MIPREPSAGHAYQPSRSGVVPPMPSLPPFSPGARKSPFVEADGIHCFVPCEGFAQRCVLD